MKVNRPSTTRWWLWLGVALTIYKLWLVRAQPIFAISNAYLDDRLFMELAQSIVRGDWLGTYSQFTLAKGPCYSLFIASMFYLGIPLGLAQQGLYAGACAFFSQAFRPIFPIGTRVAIYLLLLWNPMSHEAPTLGRVMRQHLVTPLGIMILAGLVALYLRRTELFKRLWKWAVFLGVSIGLFWITREESVWILPSILLLAGAIVIGANRNSRDSLRAVLWAGSITLFCAILPTTLVSWQNYRHYQWFGTVEFKAHEFKAAYGALQRVNVGPEYYQVPVTREARAAIYAHSPAFKTLQPWLERDAWTHVAPLPEGNQIRGGWFMWALRESVALAGHTSNAHEALSFYQTLADEINAACDSGLIPSYPRRDSMIPRFRSGQISEVGRTFLSFGYFVASFNSFSAFPKLSIGDREELKLFHDLTRDELSSSERAPAIERPNQEKLRLWKFHELQKIGEFLIPILFLLCILAHIIASVRVIQLVRTCTITYPMVLATAAWGGVASFILINALVHVLSFSVTAVSTFSPTYPLLIIFYIAVFWDAINAWFPSSTLMRDDFKDYSPSGLNREV
jgi:hypothetical protein